MLYAHIGVYHYSTGKIDVKDEKALFSEQINNLLRSYKDGYYLERSNGFIMEMPNKALQEQLSYDGAELSEDVLEQNLLQGCIIVLIQIWKLRKNLSTFLQISSKK